MIDSMEVEIEMVERHLQVLKQVRANEPIGIVNLSAETGYPQHKVRYSLRVLEEEGLVEPSSQGAITTDRTDEFADGLNGHLQEAMDRLEAMTVRDAKELVGEGPRP